MSLKTKFPKGAEWRKWDLHVHTPDSIVHHYTGVNNSLQWEKFLQDIESLPAEFKVLGINDYLFIDGYRKILEYRKQGRLQNINTILPVVEFRIKKFAGHKDFKRVNFHVIFSDKLTPDVIQYQFLNALVGKYQLSPGLNGIKWNATITYESLIDLGKEIKKSIPAGELYKYGSDLAEGFNNLNLDEEDIISLLKENSYLKNNYLTAIGKTEWESLSWNDQSIAEKKDIINKVDFIFISSKSVEAFRNAKNKLEENLVNSLLLDCSDAHYNSDVETEKDRIGKCFTWIKGDPTFNGLKQIKYEQTTRVFIQDDKPEEKTAYNVIEKVKFISSESSTFFEKKAIELNPNLNVIIGGKSSGKSLLLYHISKTIDPSQVKEKMEIVNQEEYNLFDKVDGFDFAVKWKDGTINKITDLPETRSRKITYIPQMYINHLAEQQGEKKLAELIEDILYQNNEFKKFSEARNKIIQDLNLKIGNEINEVFSILENVKTVAKEIRDVGDAKAIQENIDKVKKEITDLNEKSGFTQAELSKFNKFQKRKERTLSTQTKVEGYTKRIEEYTELLGVLKNEVVGRIDAFPLNIYEIDDEIALQFISKNILQDIQQATLVFDSLIKKYTDLNNNFNKAILSKTQKIALLDEDLSPFIAKVKNQQLLKRLEKELLDDENKIKRIEEKEKRYNQIKGAGSQKKAEMLATVDNLFENYKLLLEQIQKPELSQIDENLNLVTTLEIDKASFQDGFCSMLDGRANFSILLGDCFDSNNSYVYEFDSHVVNLKSLFDKVWNSEQNQIKFRSGYNSQDAITQLFKDHYKFKYNIKYNGDDILQMSPGKRGLVLLQIILHLSNAKYPILIDQPEDNLDNRTIFNDLNDFVKQKKIQRQIILVTHNANLVVSTDSEEVIVANQTGQDAGKTNEKYQFEYVSGSLENTFRDLNSVGVLNQMGIREHVCDILEGGEAAFIYRERKYGLKD